MRDTESLTSTSSQQHDPLRICIVGTGAIGGLIGVRLACAGHELTFVDRGERLAAMCRDGLKLEMADGEVARLDEVRATGDLSDAGPQDLVFLAVKSHHIADVAAGLPALFTPQTVVVTVQNGIPWWYFKKHGGAGAYEGRRIQALDPSGVIEKNIAANRVMGCVAYPAAVVSEPGVVRHVEGNRFPVGELDGSESDRCQRLCDVLTAAGFKSRVIADIRAEIWLKAWGTMSINPISALTHATMEEVCRLPETRGLVVSMMEEAQEIAQRLGISFRHTIEKRVAGAEAVGPHKTSMLQDVEAGAALELDALMAAVIELGEITGSPTPALRSIYAATKLLERTYSSAGSRVALIPRRRPGDDVHPGRPT